MTEYLYLVPTCNIILGFYYVGVNPSKNSKTLFYEGRDLKDKVSSNL